MSQYHFAALARRRELWMRIGFAILITMAATYGARSVWPAIWFIGVCCAQGLNVVAGNAAAVDATFAPSPGWKRRYLAVQCLNSAVFASIGGYLWFAVGEEGRLIALVVLMGALLNFGTQPHTSGRLLWWGSAPYVLTLGGLPIITLFVEPDTSVVLICFFILGAFLYLLHVLREVRRRELAAIETRIALDRAESASAAKSEFVATMSHEIRTPLNGVLGMVQAMAGDPLPPVQRQRLEVIRQSGTILLTLLNDLLDMAKIEAAKLALEDGLLDVDQLAVQAREAFVSLAADKDIDLIVSVADDAAGRWKADPVRVRQILYNLLSNAIKFTDRGVVTATLDLSPGGHLRISVSDTGSGISEENLSGLFERFVQGDASTTRRFGGTGLGLAICRDLARLMGGDLTLESELGKGSTFTAVLPLARGEPPVSEQTKPEPVDVDGLKLLVAEDNPTNRLVISTLLGQLGIAAHVVQDGLQAYEAWKAESWDIVLMDIQMPVMDGIEATRRIRLDEQAGGLAATPIIALTANAMSHHRTQYDAEGFDGVVPKPVQLEVLIAALEAVSAAEGSGHDACAAVVNAC